MKYTTCWQRKRMACSFNHHPRHKAVKKIWITYSVTRKALGARQVNLISRTREIVVLFSGGMGEPSAYATCAGYYRQQTGSPRVFGFPVGNTDLSVGNALYSWLMHCTELQSVLLWQLLHFLPCSLPLRQPSPTKQPGLSRGWPLFQVKRGRELGPSECVGSSLCSCFTVSYGPLNLHALLWLEMPCFRWNPWSCVAPRQTAEFRSDFLQSFRIL